MVFEDTNLKLTLISEDIKSYYTVRQLELENLSVSTARTAALQAATGAFGCYYLGQFVWILCTLSKTWLWQYGEQSLPAYSPGEQGCLRHRGRWL